MPKHNGTKDQKEQPEPVAALSEKQIKAPEIVVNKMMKQIETGQLKAGQKLPPQIELSKAFGVGMSSVREAINILQVMGYLEVTHGRGTFVKSEVPLSKTLLEKLEHELNQSSPYELFELRELIESQAVRMAAQRADQKAIDEIRSALELLRKSETNRTSFVSTDMAFHLAIPRSIDLRGTAAIVQLIFECMHKHFELAYKTRTTDYRTKAIASAEEIVEHIEKGDAPLAVRSMRRHLDLTKHAIVRLDTQ